MSAIRRLIQRARQRNPTRLEPEDAYARWASDYGLEPNEVQRLEEATLSRLLPDLRNKDVFDAGCGKARLAALALEHGARRAVAGDLSLPMLMGPGAHRHDRLSVLRLDVSFVPFPAAVFDVVLCALVLGHCRELEPPLAELSRVLRPGGYLLISDFHPEATRRGWKRTFSTEGRSYEVAHHVHLLSDYARVMDAVGLTPETPEESSFEDVPVVFALRARRPAVA